MIEPAIAAKILDSITLNKDINKFEFVTILFIMITLLENLISYYSSVLSAKYNSKIVFDINLDIMEHIKRIPYSISKNFHSEYLTQRISTDTNALISFVLGNVTTLIIQSISSIISLIVLIKLSFKSAFILLFFVPIYCVLVIYSKKILYKNHFKFKEQQNRFFSSMNDQMSNLKFIKTNGILNYMANKLKDSFNKLLLITVDYTKLAIGF